MSTTPSALISGDIPATVRAGSLQFFLYQCANHAARTGKLKTLKIDGEASLVISQTEHLRRVLRVSGAEYWIPRKTVANKELWQPSRLERARRLRRRRHKSLWNPPFWKGEARPNAENVPLSKTYRTLSWGEKARLVNELMFPASAAFIRSSMPMPLHNPEPRQEKSRRELGEIVIVKTPFNAMEPEQRAQQEDHDRLTKVLAGLRMSSVRENAAYEVIVLGHGVREVAESRGLNAKSLAVTVSQLKRRMEGPEA